jgi:hypothetical protein
MTPTGVEQSVPSPATAARRGRSGTWVRVALACSLLLGSAALRAVQARRIEKDLEEGLRRFRIDLDTIPLTLGPWKGEKTELDPMIARGTGADKVVTRRYVNASTGATVEVILLYGPAVGMYVHIPEVCYPAAGFTGPADAAFREIVSGPYTALFRSLVYAKGEGAQAEMTEVYYSWRREKNWTPVIGTQKEFERIPSMYKVQLARRVTGRERRDVGNPCEAFLRELLPQFERRLSTSQSATAEGRG